MSAHNCDAMVICCIDFRFQEYIRKWTNENLQGKKFDLLGIAGVSKNLDATMEQIDISVRLHHINQVVVIHHEECGAYGAESSFEKHTSELKKAKTAINAKYPDLKVDLYYLKLNGEMVAV